MLNKELPEICFKCDSLNIPFYSLTDKDLILVAPLTKEIVKRCNTCKRTIAKNHRHIHCHSCDSKVHIKCNLTDVQTYEKIIIKKLPQSCFQCISKNIPFHSITDQEFFQIDSTSLSPDNQSHSISSTTPTPSSIKIHCGICAKTIAKNHRFVNCKSCKSKVHIKCNNTDAITYNSLSAEDRAVICITCQCDNIPFQKLSEIDFSATIKGVKVNTETLEEVSITSTNLKTFFREINKNNPF